MQTEGVCAKSIGFNSTDNHSKNKDDRWDYGQLDRQKQSAAGFVVVRKLWNSPGMNINKSSSTETSTPDS